MRCCRLASDFFDGVKNVRFFDILENALKIKHTSKPLFSRSKNHFLTLFIKLTLSISHYRHYIINKNIWYSSAPISTHETSYTKNMNTFSPLSRSASAPADPLPNLFPTLNINHIIIKISTHLDNYPYNNKIRQYAQ